MGKVGRPDTISRERWSGHTISREIGSGQTPGMLDLRLSSLVQQSNRDALNARDAQCSNNVRFLKNEIMKPFHAASLRKTAVRPSLVQTLSRPDVRGRERVWARE